MENVEKKDEDFQNMDSVNGIIWVAKRWGEVEMLVTILSLKIQEITKEDFLPTNFMIDPETKSVSLSYENGKVRTIPLEVVLVMNNGEMFTKLVELYLQMIDPSSSENPE